MTLVRLASLIGTALLAMVLSAAMSVRYMVGSSYLRHAAQRRANSAGHLEVDVGCRRVVADIPLMFVAGLWVAGWAASEGQLGVKAALVVWLAYAIIDVGIVLGAGGINTKLCVLVAVSLVTKLAAACAGALVAVHSASQNA